MAYLQHKDTTLQEGLEFLTLGAHARRGLQYLDCNCVCLSATTFSATTRKKSAKE